jgi:hypothetical protein
VRWPEYVSMARAAEEVGFDSLWVGDHLLYRDDGRPERGPWDAWALLAGLAAVTERVAIGPLVACTAFRPPGVLARTATTIDELSGGRLVLATSSHQRGRLPSRANTCAVGCVQAASAEDGCVQAASAEDGCVQAASAEERKFGRASSVRPRRFRPSAFAH